jgi:regulator of sirC expression with transglutaminase-like and TPR domain
MQYKFGLLAQVILFSCLAFGSLPVIAKNESSDQATVLREIRTLLSTPEAQLDLAKAKLTLDHMIDPGIDVASTLKQLDIMAGQAKALVPPNANKRETLHALQVYLYVAGPWNNQQPFQYDLEDPLGQNIRNKLLTTYLAKRKGNCVSMPMLFIILGQKLGLDVTAAKAPLHIFVKFRDEQGQMINVEATTGGFKQDASYQQDFPMTKEAIASGIYMRRLGKRGTVVAMAETLQQYYGQLGLQERRIAIGEILLKADSKDVTTMLNMGSAYYKLLQKHFLSKYPTPNAIPLEERPYYEELGRNNQLWFNKAEALGWRQQSKAEDDKYLRTIKTIKAKK